MIALFWFLAFLEEDRLLVLKYVELLSESTTYYVVRTSKVRTFYVIMSCYLLLIATYVEGSLEREPARSHHVI